MSTDDGKCMSSNASWLDLHLNGSAQRMQVDSGAKCSLIPAEMWSAVGKPTLKATRVKVSGLGHNRLNVLGTTVLRVKCLSDEKVLEAFVYDGDDAALFGRDWMDAFGLGVTKIQLATLAGITPIANGSLDSLLKEYADVFEPTLGKVDGFKAHLHVKPDARFKLHKPRPVAFALKRGIDEALTKLEESGVVEKVDTAQYGTTPLVPVVKPNGQVRICGDFKITLNRHVDVQQYPLPHIDELFSLLAGGTRFAKIDLKDPYLQIELDDESKQYAVLTTHRGLYRYNRLAFGLSPAPAIFQSIIEQVLRGLPRTGAYLDDILVTGDSDEDLVRNIRSVLERLRKYNVHANMEKCEFQKDRIEYLGFEIDRTGIRPAQKKCEAITNVPTPRNVEQLGSFLGMIQYYGKHIPNMSSICGPLNELRKAGCAFEWTSRRENAFQQLKSALTSPAVLVPYDDKKALGISADASHYGVGAVLFHIYADKSEKPIYYASRTLNDHEKNYSQIEKEALAIVYAIQKFHKFVWGRHFKLYTDHKPLLKILGPHSEVSQTTLSRLQRWSVLLGGYDYEIAFKTSAENANADCLSRLPLGGIRKNELDCDIYAIQEETVRECPVSAAQIRQQTAREPVLSRVLGYTMYGWPEQCDSESILPYFRKRYELTVQEGCLLWGLRVVIPQCFRKELLHELHESHSGMVKMKSVARGKIWWPNIDAEIENCVRDCTRCAEIANSPAEAPLHSWDLPSGPWQRVHLDFAGPFYGSMWLVYVDAYSKFAGSIQMRNTTGQDLVGALRELFSTFGLVEQLVTDNGPQFVSEEIRKFCATNGIKHIRSAPYRPQTNGEAERFVQTFKQGIRAQDGSSLPIYSKVQRFLFNYRSTQHATTGHSPAELMFGRNFRTRLDLLRPSVRENVSQSWKRQQDSHNKSARYREFDVGSSVYAKWYVGVSKWKAGIVVRRTGPLSYDVRVGNEIVSRHVAQLLPSGSTNEQNTQERPTSHNIGTPDTSGTGNSIVEPSRLADRGASGVDPMQATLPKPIGQIDTSCAGETTSAGDESESGPRRPKRNPPRMNRFDEEFGLLGSNKPKAARREFDADVERDQSSSLKI